VDTAGYSWKQLDTARYSWIQLNTAGYSWMQLDTAGYGLLGAQFGVSILPHVGQYLEGTEPILQIKT
jgi:hypothetical protein